MSGTNNPTIVIGMHRSGTTLVANVLRQLGLHQGWLLQENTEAVFFVSRNEALINSCGGRWDHPLPVKHLIECPSMRARAVEILRRDIHAVSFLSFLGPRRARYLGQPEKLGFAWGWKDPRNTFTLPLWLELFPDARILHVYRHPMDVARSLCVRENRSIDRRVTTLAGNDPGRDPRLDVKDIRREVGWLWLYRRLHTARCAAAPFRRYSKLGVSATATLAGGLRLWSSYVGECFRHLTMFSNQSLSVRYEDILSDPAPRIDEIRRFCGLPGDMDQVRQACASIRVERRFAYRNDAAAREAFDPYRNNEWVRHLGYDVDETP